MPKVVMVGQGIDPLPPLNEAIKIQCHHLATGLAEHGWQVATISRTSRRLPQLLRADRAWVVRLPGGRRPVSGRFWSLVALLLIRLWLRPDVIHFWGVHALLPLHKVFARWHKRRVVITIYRPLAAGRELRLLREASGWPLEVVVEDDTLQDSVREACGHQATVIPPGVRTDWPERSQATTETAQTLRAYFASAPISKAGQDEAAYLSSRGVYLSLELVECVAARVPMELDLYWRSEPTRAVRELADKAEHAHLLTHSVADLASHVRGYALCMIPSDSSARSKAIPLSALEALAQGIPVVARVGTPLAGIVEREGIGFAVDASTLEATSERIASALTNSDALAAMSERARTVCRAQYGLGLMVERYRRIYGENVCTSC